jgi:hypothetical protein
MLAYFLAISCVIVAVMYYVLPGRSLPTFMPGYDVGSTRIHKLHGFAALTDAVVFFADWPLDEASSLMTVDRRTWFE